MTEDFKKNKNTKKPYSFEIEISLEDELKEYCEINDYKIGPYINYLIRKAFDAEKANNLTKQKE